MKAAQCTAWPPPQKRRLPAASTAPSMPSVPSMPPATVQWPLATHEQGRADIHALMAALLLRPGMALIQALANAADWPEDVADADLADAGTALNPLSLATAWRKLQGCARVLGPQGVLDEHAALFHAVGAPAVDPCASLYIGGHLMDEPLARLRADLRALGLARSAGAAHTEDHLGALCETMRLLITGAPAPRPMPPQTLQVQRHFFETHLLPWADACLHDLRSAPGACFYAALADCAQAFFATERQAFELDDTPTEHCLAPPAFAPA